MSIVPCIMDEKLIDGTLIQMLPFCQRNCCHGKCKEHYDKMSISNVGFYVCPNGLSSLVYMDNDGNKVIYSGLRVKHYYDKKLAKVAQTTESLYNPLLSSDQMLALVNEDNKLRNKMISIAEKEDEIKDVLHETRKLNAQIKTICDLIWDEYTNKELSNQDIINLYDRISNIHVCSYMAYNRFAYYDISTNPKLVLGAPYETGVFKKFDKLRKLLKNYSRKKVWISLEDQSTFTYKVYPTFETLLFIILENAIKYSPDDQPVNVYFKEENNCLDVSVISLGPYCEEDEINCITNKGYRGINAQLFDNTGQGIGLSFAKKIADIHNIDIQFTSDFTMLINNIKFGHFCVKLHFDKSQQDI